MQLHSENNIFVNKLRLIVYFYMSTDVYVDFSGSPLMNRIAYTERIGDLGTLTFKNNLIKWLQILNGACPIVTDHVVIIIPLVFDWFNNELSELRNHDPDWLAQLGSIPDWDDIATSEEMLKFFGNGIHLNWRIRID